MAFWQDVRYAVRALRSAPAFSAIAIVSLGLGIGANTTIYRVIDETMLHDVTADRPDRLLRVGNLGISYPNYRDLAGSGVFQSLSLYGITDWNWREATATERVSAMITSPNLFETLGVNPVMGRRYSAADAEALPALVTQGFWKRRLGGDPKVLGQTLELNEHRFTIVGVLPANYRSVMGLAIVPEV